ncbi:PREDICTED: beta-mannosidase-like [Amphimedon queenslandica]|uniref:beta-mannosidase n=1 Tax=Amphimedon queenslandica TaxID=400682 RepID=A0AAN0IPM2_AMPQE|nr:PREDICTED: beta-mannosidase-like [Amphimedon queenslandica]|eukprot:XP_011405906.1 PREDICTED: beta-mannosidase-like [Amphimedon queenslandica]
MVSYMMQFLLGCSLLLLSALQYSKADQIERSLDGENWQLSDSAGKVKGLPATVPGIVHLDLLAHKVIDDPYFGENDDKYQWIAYSDWIYEATFDLTDADINNRQLFMKCDGLDTAATLKVNGMMIGSANSFHRRWLFNMTDAVKTGTNSLQVYIQSAANYSIARKNAYPYDVSGNGRYFSGAARNFIRKTQSDFGWDWGPAFVPAGIWKNISYVTASDVYVTEIVPKPHCNETDETYYMEALVCYIQLVEGQYSMQTSIAVDNTPFSKEFKADPFNFPNSPGVKQCARFFSYTVKSSDMDNYLWKPHSSSNPKPQLYQATVSVTIMKDGKELFSVNQMRKVGFRNIKVISNEQPPNKETGFLFYFQQTDSNGKYPIYAKGSNFIPMDAFVTRATPEVAEHLIKSAAEGNQNMIRVWGGGLYQPDWFYDLCDEYGVMVWQEFMFGDAQYPRDRDFLENVREEVIDNVRRLGYHPSIVLWSGNNENEAGGLKNTQTLVDYVALYDFTIRATLWEEDTTRSYWPASPSNGAEFDVPEMGVYVERWGDPQNSTMGDIHRYDYSSTCNDVTKFPRPRFASEFGFQSYPSFYSLSKISTSSDWSNDSPFFADHRQHHTDGNKQMQNMMAKFFHLPNNTDSVEQFKDFIYLSQVVQVICIGSEAEHYHRLLSEAGAYTRGTLYWQLNDIWQAQTWASIEYAGRWKLLHYAMKKIYSDVSVSAYQLNGSIGIYVIVDDPQMSIKYSLSVDIISWDGKTVSQKSVPNLQSEGFTGTQVAEYKISDIF